MHHEKLCLLILFANQKLFFKLKLGLLAKNPRVEKFLANQGIS